ncbi:Uncharacterized protein DBV15_00021 [Temnothorax longispinosus]|uniref:Uncharacterized protein n=1 Tax=Temnothorax longispinosus TaxID=300112 RepID=A0A4S2KDT2_9HYME|nr:Uncharacterized protein DBV15_00021 [Temnothorax longispinosus]
MLVEGRASPLDSTVSGAGRVGGRKGKGELSSEGQPSALTPLTENSGQTSGRLDETAERHETEGKRKWQSLSEGASTPPFILSQAPRSLRYLRISCFASKFELEIMC